MLGVRGQKYHNMKFLIFHLILFLVFMVMFECSEPETKSNSTEVKEVLSESNKTLNDQNVWYEGGNLHNANAIEWQNADYDNKLATAGDFIATIWMDNGFNKSIQGSIKSLVDVKILAKELVICLDEAFEKDPDPEQNEFLFTNQMVSSATVICMVLMGWTE